MCCKVKKESRNKRVTAVVEALIGVYHSSHRQSSSYIIYEMIGIYINFIDAPLLSYFIVSAEKLVNHLEFLRDVVLDYVLTTHHYFKCPKLVPRLITYLRSILVNNECNAQYEVKSSMHEHIVHASLDRKNQICCTVQDFEKFDLVFVFRWVSESTFPNMLGDVIEYFASV
ncbi:hypothetical protein EJD97_000580 [Solanum chilense]|uniref:RNase III domain-containing protein n=1 Tax=Solanum chilense TaxID=4083 RepID=A0A6N2AN04_SOLCI|nr:hypothetical protein EJD97_000580 [Solanum chilense]